MPNLDWQNLFTKWITQKSSIVRVPHVLSSIYPSDHTFQHKELSAWCAMFQACGCTNITPYSKEESDVEFWTCAVDSEINRQTLKNLYKWELLQTQDFSYTNTTNCQFWDSFCQALDTNKKGAKGKIRILSIIALDFSYQDLQNELGVRH